MMDSTGASDDVMPSLSHSEWPNEENTAPPSTEIYGHLFECSNGRAGRRLRQTEGIPVTSKIVIIGRDSRLSVRINDPKISREQCELTIEDSNGTHRVYVKNLTKRKTTFVDSTALDLDEQRELTGDMEFRITDHILQWVPNATKKPDEMDIRENVHTTPTPNPKSEIEEICNGVESTEMETAASVPARGQSEIMDVKINVHTGSNDTPTPKLKSEIEEDCNEESTEMETETAASVPARGQNEMDIKENVDTGNNNGTPTLNPKLEIEEACNEVESTEMETETAASVPARGQKEMDIKENVHTGSNNGTPTPTPNPKLEIEEDYNEVESTVQETAAAASVPTRGQKEMDGSNNGTPTPNPKLEIEDACSEVESTEMETAVSVPARGQKEMDIKENVHTGSNDTPTPNHESEIEDACNEVESTEQETAASVPAGGQKEMDGSNIGTPTPTPNPELEIEEACSEVESTEMETAASVPARGRKRKTKVNDDEEIARAEQTPTTRNKRAAVTKSAKTEPEKLSNVDEAKEPAGGPKRRQKRGEKQVPNEPEATIEMEPEAPIVVVTRGRHRKTKVNDEETTPAEQAPATATRNKRAAVTKSAKTEPEKASNVDEAKEPAGGPKRRLKRGEKQVPKVPEATIEMEPEAPIPIVVVTRGRKRKTTVNDEETTTPAEQAPATSNKRAVGKKSAKTEPEKASNVDEAKEPAGGPKRRQKRGEKHVPEEPEATIEIEPETLVAVVSRGRKRKVTTKDEETAASTKKVPKEPEATIEMEPEAPIVVVTRGRKRKTKVNDEETTTPAEQAPATSNKRAVGKKSAKTEPEKASNVDEAKEPAGGPKRRQKRGEKHVPEEPEAPAEMEPETPVAVVSRGRKRKVTTKDEETAASTKKVLQTKSDKIDAPAPVSSRPVRNTRSQKK